MPGWHDLLGKPLQQVVAAQWNTTSRLLVDDLEQLPPGSWTAASYEAFVAQPEAEVRRLCDFNSLPWDRTLPQVLPLSSYTVSAPDPDKWQRYAALIDEVWPQVRDQAKRAELLLDRSLDLPRRQIS